MIVLDTSVLSLVFRRSRGAPEESPHAWVLRRMITEDWTVSLPGIVLQELLSVVRDAGQLGALQHALEGFPVLLAREDDHRRGAEIHNACRGAGVACSTIDALIAAQTISAGGALFTADRDFRRMAPFCGLALFSGPGAG